MNKAIADLVTKIYKEVRYREITEQELQQLCYTAFVTSYPPGTRPELPPGAHSRYTILRLPPGWRHFTSGVTGHYDGTTRLAFAIARKLALLVRKLLDTEQFVLPLGA